MKNLDQWNVTELNPQQMQVNNGGGLFPVLLPLVAGTAVVYLGPDVEKTVRESSDKPKKGSLERLFIGIFPSKFD